MQTPDAHALSPLRDLGGALVALVFLGIFLSMLAAGPSASSASLAVVATASDRTVVSIVGESAPTQKIDFTDNDQDRVISVQVHICNGTDPCEMCWVSVTIRSGTHSRAEIAHALMEKIVACGGVVDSHGPNATSFSILHAGPDPIVNYGTPDQPKYSPDNDPNKPCASYYSKS